MLRLAPHIIKGLDAEGDRDADNISRLRAVPGSDSLGAFRQYANASLFVSL